MMIAKIRTLKAPDNTETCLKYLEGYRKVLESYGIKQLSSTTHAWLHDPNTYVVVVETEDGERLLGGMRIQIRSEALKMPMEDAIAKIDKNIYDYMDRFGNYNVAEVCGLFNSKEVAGYGFGSIFLGRIAVAIAGKMDIQYLVSLCSPTTLRQCLKIGFEIQRELGNNGKFYYPKEGLIATSLIVKDLPELSNALPEEKERILDLRNNPVQEALEKGPKGELTIFYETRI